MAAVRQHISLRQRIFCVVVAYYFLFRQHLHCKLLACVLFFNEIDFSEASFAQYWNRNEISRINLFLKFIRWILVYNLNCLGWFESKAILLMIKHWIFIHYFAFGDVFNIDVYNFDAVVVVFLFLVNLNIMLIRPIMKIFHHTWFFELFFLLNCFVRLTITKNMRKSCNLCYGVKTALNNIRNALNIYFFAGYFILIVTTWFVSWI